MKRMVLGMGIVVGALSGQAYSLEECITIALRNKENLKASALSVESAKEEVRSSYSGILPSASFSGGWNENRFPEQTGGFNSGTGEIITGVVSKYSSVSSGISMSQTLYDGGIWWNTIAKSKNDYHLAKQFDRQIQINIIKEVHRSFFSYLKSKQLLEVARLNLKSSRRQMELVKRQFELGAVKKTDLLKAEVSLGQGEIDVLNQETAVKSAYRELKNAMGLIGAELEFEIADAGQPLEEIPELKLGVETLESYNPSLLAKRHQILSADLSRKLIQGTRLPNLSLSLRYSGSAADASTLSSKWNENWQMSTGFTLSVPLFTGRQNTVRIQQAKLNLGKEESEYIYQKQDLIVALSALLDVLNNYNEIIPLNEKVLTSAEEDLKLAQERYSLGAATILEVLDAQVSVSRAQSSVITAKYDARIQQANLKALLGILDSDLQ